MSLAARVDGAVGYDGIKLDGCGEFLNLTLWADLLNKTGRPVMIESKQMKGVCCMKDMCFEWVCALYEGCVLYKGML